MEKVFDQLWGKTGTVEVSLENKGVIPRAKIKVTYASGSQESGVPVARKGAFIMDLASPDGTQETHVTITRNHGRWTLKTSDGRSAEDTGSLKRYLLGNWQVKSIHSAQAQEVSIGEPRTKRGR